jgi:hypothetical protein
VDPADEDKLLYQPLGGSQLAGSEISRTAGIGFSTSLPFGAVVFSGPGAPVLDDSTRGALWFNPAAGTDGALYYQTNSKWELLADGPPSGNLPPADQNKLLFQETGSTGFTGSEISRDATLGFSTTLPIGAVVSASAPPTDPTTQGALWFDTNIGRLKYMRLNTWQLIADGSMGPGKENYLPIFASDNSTGAKYINLGPNDVVFDLDGNTLILSVDGGANATVTFTAAATTTAVVKAEIDAAAIPGLTTSISQGIVTLQAAVSLVVRSIGTANRFLGLSTSADTVGVLVSTKLQSDSEIYVDQLGITHFTNDAGIVIAPRTTANPNTEYTGRIIFHPEETFLGNILKNRGLSFFDGQNWLQIVGTITGAPTFTVGTDKIEQVPYFSGTNEIWGSSALKTNVARGNVLIGDNLENASTRGAFLTLGSSLPGGTPSDLSSYIMYAGRVGGADSKYQFIASETDVYSTDFYYGIPSKLQSMSFQFQHKMGQTITAPNPESYALNALDTLVFLINEAVTPGTTVLTVTGQTGTFTAAQVAALFNDLNTGSGVYAYDNGGQLEFYADRSLSINPTGFANPVFGFSVVANTDGVDADGTRFSLFGNDETGVLLRGTTRTGTDAMEIAGKPGIILAGVTTAERTDNTTSTGIQTYAKDGQIVRDTTDDNLYFWKESSASWVQVGGGGGGVTGSGTSPVMPYWTGATSLGDSNITFDSVNNRTEIVRSGTAQLSASFDTLTLVNSGTVNDGCGMSLTSGADGICRVAFATPSGPPDFEIERKFTSFPQGCSMRGFGSEIIFHEQPASPATPDQPLEFLSPGGIQLPSSLGTPAITALPDGLGKMIVSNTENEIYWNDGTEWERVGNVYSDTPFSSGLIPTFDLLDDKKLVPSYLSQSGTQMRIQLPGAAAGAFYINQQFYIDNTGAPSNGCEMAIVSGASGISKLIFGNFSTPFVGHVGQELDTLRLNHDVSNQKLELFSTTSLSPKITSVSGFEISPSTTANRTAVVQQLGIIYPDSDVGTVYVSDGSNWYDVIKDLTPNSIVVGSPTGGNQGAGTINAQGVYDDGVLLTDFVFEKYYEGKARDERHADYEMKSLSEEVAHTKERMHLSTMPSREEFESKKMSLGDMATRLWETVETQFLYIKELEERISKLESKS